MMLRLLIILIVLCLAGWITAEDSCYFHIDDFNRYLGLAVPVPDKIPDLIIDQMQYAVPIGNYRADLIIDKKGKVKEVKFPADSEAVYRPLLDKYKNIRFKFLDGLKIDNKLTVPVNLEVIRDQGTDKSLRLVFPVSPAMVSDTVLLNSFWEANNIEPPSLRSIMPIFYRVTVEDSAEKYQTITALVSLDEKGEVIDIQYPFENQRENNHYVHVALMRAGFNPAQAYGKVIPCEILITFRIFNNLAYPLDLMATPDSLKPTAITRKYFCLIYYNERDIVIPALPHENPYGYLSGSKVPSGEYGVLHLEITINEKGRVIRAFSPNIFTGKGRMANKLLRAMSWYPAVNHCGEKVPFTGNVTIYFERKSRVVYSSDWLDF